MLVLAPSDEFVAGLPRGRLTDRDDFKQLDNKERQRIWKTVVAESNRLADEFEKILQNQSNLLDKIEVMQHK